MVSAPNCVSEDHLLAVDDPGRIHRVRQVLDRAGYSNSGIREVFGGEDETLRLGPRDVPRLLHRCDGDSPLEAFIRLFLIGVPVQVDTFRRAIAPTAVEEWIELGLVEVDGSAVARIVEILAGAGLLVAQHAPHYPKPPSREPVMSIAPDSTSTWTLSQVTIRRPSAATLDLGTGSGLHALLAARHSREVVAVDCNGRALNLAAFNAHLNGLANITCHAGNFFEPVAGQRFDLVVSNPPFVISPERLGVYRDSGLPGDLVCQQIVEELPRFLRPGGFGQVLVNWAHVRGESWQERVRTWVAGRDCDAWVLRFHTLDPADYATSWLPPELAEDSEAFSRRFEAWLAYYERERIEAISYGLITLRARPGVSNWFACEDAPELIGPCGAAIARGFAQRDFAQASGEDQTLLAARLRAAPQVRWEQQAAPGNASVALAEASTCGRNGQAVAPGWSLRSSRLRLARGLAYQLEVDANVLDLVARCRGDRTLGAVLDDLSASLRQDRSEVIPAGLTLARCLLEHGFLLPDAGDIATEEPTGLPDFLIVCRDEPRA
jgi:methylase of polypeptide subunit release factors